MKRLRAWLAAKTISRGRLLAYILMSLALPDVPRHPALVALRWVMAASATGLGLILIYATYVTRFGRRRWK